MNVLCIGNSFSQDATRYLHQIAACDNVDLNVLNLYIGGCSFKKHYINCINNKYDYLAEFNGKSVGIYTSILQALIRDADTEWDYITIQQVSNYSVNYKSFQPYAEKLTDIIRQYCPQSKLLIHQTWAYEDGSNRLCDELKYKSSDLMLNDIVNSYNCLAKDVNAYGIIPSGIAFSHAIKEGIIPIHRDTFHAKLGIGRYLLALLWYRCLTNNDVTNNSFDNFDEHVSKEHIAIAKDIAQNLSLIK